MSDNSITAAPVGKIRKRILLVEDEASLRKVLAHVLTHCGYDVLQADDAEFALVVLRQQPVDLVITDILLGAKDGIEMLMEMKHVAKGTPFIAMSGGGRMEAAHYLDVAKALGAHAVLPKPFGHENLIAAVRSAVGE